LLRIIIALVRVRKFDRALATKLTAMKASVLATGSSLMEVHRIGPAATDAARILADAGDIARLPSRSHFACWSGTASIDASRGRNAAPIAPRPEPAA